ncbi:MAG: hypothetical protein WA979_02745 [Pacificimonas sp.]
MMLRPRKRQSLAAIFAWPLAFAAASLLGLLLGLTGDGWRDAAAWLLLGAVPLAVLIMWLRRDARPPVSRPMKDFR